MSTKNEAGSILLVEDNPDDIELPKRAFRKSHLCNKLIVMRDGQEALDYLFGTDSQGRPNPRPLVMLLDLNMPRINELEVLQQIRAAKTTRMMPVVVLTTSDEQRDVIDSYQLGASNYIRKPVDSKDIFVLIQLVELYWTVRNQGKQ